MARFPIDAPKSKVIKALEILGFQVVREREHISLVRDNADGSRTPMTLPNHATIKSSTWRAACSQAGIPRDEFLRAYSQA